MLDNSSIEYGLSQYGIALIENDETVVVIYGVDVDYDTFQYQEFCHYEYARDEFAKIALNYLDDLMDSNGAYNAIAMSPCEMVADAFNMFGEDIFGARGLSLDIEEAVKLVNNLTNRM